MGSRNYRKKTQLHIRTSQIADQPRSIWNKRLRRNLCPPIDHLLITARDQMGLGQLEFRALRFASQDNNCRSGYRNHADND